MITAGDAGPGCVRVERRDIDDVKDTLDVVFITLYQKELVTICIDSERGV